MGELAGDAVAAVFGTAAVLALAVACALSDAGRIAADTVRRVRARSVR